MKHDVGPGRSRVWRVHAVGAAGVARRELEGVAGGGGQPAATDGAVGQTRDGLNRDLQ